MGKMQHPPLNVPPSAGSHGSAGRQGGSSPLPAATAFVLREREQVQSLPTCPDLAGTLLCVRWVQGHLGSHVWPGTGMAAKSPWSTEHPLQHVLPGRAADAERLAQDEENHLSGVRGFNQRSRALHSPAAPGRVHHKSNQQVRGRQEPSAGRAGGLCCCRHCWINCFQRMGRAPAASVSPGPSYKG